MNEEKMLILASFLDQVKEDDMSDANKSQILAIVYAIIFDKVTYIKKHTRLSNKIKKLDLIKLIGPYIIDTNEPWYYIYRIAKCTNVGCCGYAYATESYTALCADREITPTCSYCKTKSSTRFKFKTLEVKSEDDNISLEG